MTANRYILTTGGGFLMIPSDAELYHHGVKGQKWGVRRYQNKDGSLTAAGKKRAAKLNEKLEDKRSRTKDAYRTAITSASAARSADNKQDYRTNKYYGIKAMDKAYMLDKKVAKIEKKMKKIGVDPEKDKRLIEDRVAAGKEYVKRSDAERMADSIGLYVANAGAVAVQTMLGAPLTLVYFPKPNIHKLRN